MTYKKTLKDRLYYYFAVKNWGVRREYEPYVNSNLDEHRKHRFKHWWILFKLNFHYRILRSKKYLLAQNVPPTVVKNSSAKPNESKKVKTETKLIPNYSNDIYRLPELLTDSEKQKRFEIVIMAYRPKNARGGGGAVCATLEKILGNTYKGVRLKYFYSDNMIYPINLENILKDFQWSIGINFKAAYFVQSRLNLWSTCDYEHDVFFVCHDLGSAYGAYLCGKKYVLIYHQQGAIVNEIVGAGFSVSDKERDIINKMEEIVMSNAQTVYFPSNGAKKEYLSTCAYDYSNINFGYPLYNTVPEKPHNLNLAKAVKDFGINEINRQECQLFLTVGDYNNNKGIDRVPIFLNRYVELTGTKVMWIAAGDKQSSGIFEALCEERENWKFESVIIGKRIAHEDILSLMELCDFYIMLHRKSIFDLATLEAMRAGLIPIMTDVGGNPEFNCDNNAILVDIEHIDDAVEALNEIKLEEMKERNRQVFDKYFSPSVFYSTYTKMLDDEMKKQKITNRVSSIINHENLSQFKNRFLGETVVICGGGTSLQNYTPLLNAKHIALNKTLFYDNVKFDMLFIQDEPPSDALHPIEDYIQYSCEKFYGIITNPQFTKMGLPEDKIIRDKNPTYRYELSPMHFDRTIDNYEFDLDSYCMADACSVLFSALQFAVYAGFKKIYLIGIDFSDVNFDGLNNTSIYARDVVKNLLNFKSNLRLYDETVDLNVIKTDNQLILNGLGFYCDIITVTGVCSEEYRHLLDLQKKSCLDNFRFDYQYFTNDEWAKFGSDSEKDDFWGYQSGLTIRIQATIERIKKYWGGILLLTDADVVYLKGTEKSIRQQLKDNDMLFIHERADSSNPYERAQMNINIGFVAMQCNENSLKFWETVKKRVEEKSGWDQEEVNLLLLENSKFITWDFFSYEYQNGGDINSKNIHSQYICTSCGTIAKRNKLSKEEYLTRMMRYAKGKDKIWFDGSRIG